VDRAETKYFKDLKAKDSIVHLYLTSLHTKYSNREVVQLTFMATFSVEVGCVQEEIDLKFELDDNAPATIIDACPFTESLSLSVSRTSGYALGATFGGSANMPFVTPELSASFNTSKSISETIADWSTAFKPSTSSVDWTMTVLPSNVDKNYPLTARYSFTKQFTINLEITQICTDIKGKVKIGVKTRSTKKRNRIPQTDLGKHHCIWIGVTQ